MKISEILAILTALGGEPNMPDQFVNYQNGGYDDAFPIQVADCPTSLGRAEIEGETVICGTVNVPENHDAPEGNRIDLVFAVMRAHSSYPETDPLLYLHGGPGGGAVEWISNYAAVFDDVRQTRDIVMFDQRAAALSGQSTSCDTILNESVIDIVSGTFDTVEVDDDGARPSDLMQACVAEIKASGTELVHYNTAQNAADVDAIMSALGYGDYNIYGISYGSRLTLEVMRSFPERIRSAIIDGVVPSHIPLYDTLAVPLSEVIDLTIEACAADQACNAAFPDLRTTLRAVLDRAAAGELILEPEGEPIALDEIIALFAMRNSNPSALTSYLPAAIYEMANEDPNAPKPALEHIAMHNGSPPRPDPVEAMREHLTDTEKDLLDNTISIAELAVQANGVLDEAILDWRTQISERDLPLARVLDDEMVKAIAMSGILDDSEALQSAVIDYAKLREQEPNREALEAFVTSYVEEQDHERLMSVIEALAPNELNSVFEKVDRGLRVWFRNPLLDLHLMIYACQESADVNSLEGYMETSTALAWPEARLQTDKTAQEIYATCEAFEPAPRPGFHDPVVSDIPVLSIASGWDTQTAPSWAEAAIETLENGQSFLIQEAAHGAIIYQNCVSDMTMSFLNDPMRTLPNTCPEATAPEFYIPPAE